MHFPREGFVSWVNSLIQNSSLPNLTRFVSFRTWDHSKCIVASSSSVPRRVFTWDDNWILLIAWYLVVCSWFAHIVWIFAFFPYEVVCNNLVGEKIRIYKQFGRIRYRIIDTTQSIRFSKISAQEHLISKIIMIMWISARYGPFRSWNILIRAYESLINISNNRRFKEYNLTISRSFG